MSTENKKMIRLRSSDKETFEIEETVALESQIIKHMIEDGCVDNIIPLPNVTAPVLAKVIQYCKKHAIDAMEVGKTDLNAWDSEFIDIDLAELFELVLAADYLDVKALLNLTSQAIADIIKNKTPEEVRSIFHIKNDYTPEEEAQVRKENQWAFQ